MQLATPEGTRQFLCKYIPKEVTDTFTVDEWNAIINAWKTETAKSEAKTPGE